MKSPMTWISKPHLYEMVTGAYKTKPSELVVLNVMISRQILLPRWRSVQAKSHLVSRGEPNPNTEKFIFDLKQYFQVTNTMVKKAITLATMHLADDANLWWRGHMDIQDGQYNINIWEILKQELCYRSS